MRKLIKLQRTDVDPKDYLKVIEKEYEMIKPYLPKKLDSVLDIGCGLGGIDVFIYRDYKPQITFFDIEGIDEKIHYGLEPIASHYNFLSETKKFVEKYGVKDAVYTNTLPTKKFNLAISLLALGYHFPLDTYKINADYLITDIRTDQPLPPNSTIISETETYRRVICKLE